MDLLSTIILIAYTTCSLLLLLYGLNTYIIVHLFLRKRKANAESDRSTEAAYAEALPENDWGIAEDRRRLPHNGEGASGRGVWLLRLCESQTDATFRRVKASSLPPLKYDSNGRGVHSAPAMLPRAWRGRHAPVALATR